MRARTLGQRVEEARIRVGWSGRRLERECGLSSGQVSLIERDMKVELSAESLFKMARALGVSGDWLWDGTDAAEAKPAGVDAAAAALFGSSAPAAVGPPLEAKIVALDYGNESVGGRPRYSREVTAAVILAHGSEKRAREAWAPIFEAKREGFRFRAKKQRPGYVPRKNKAS